MKTNTKKTIGYYLRFSKKHWLSGAATFFSMAIATVLDVTVPLYLKKFFDLLGQDSNRQALFGSLFSVLLVIAVLKLSSLALRRINNFLANYFESRVIAELSNYCFERLHLHSFGFFNNNFVGSLTKKVKWFVTAFENIVDRIIWNIMPLAVRIVFIVAVLFSVNFWLGAAVLAWLIAFIAVNWAFTKFKLRFDLQRNELETKSTGVLADTITNHQAVKLFNGLAREIKEYAKINNQLRDVRRRGWDFGAIFDTVQGVMMTALEIGVLFYAVFLWRDGNFTLGSFVLVQTYLGMIMNQMWDFGGIIRRTFENLADAEEMTVVLETPFDIVDIPNAKSLKVSKAKIEFRQVVFNYHKTRSILKDLNLEIAPKQRLAVIGSSGAGKTTLIKLLFRMHDLTAGEIMIDGQNIAKVTMESLWKNVSLVPQDPALFHRSLKDNIAYGRPNATEKEIIAAAKAANCHEFILKLENGYETFVGERGVKLSGGERQRVAIARAILKNAPILVLDEATSSLDSESEGMIQGALDNLMKDKTVIVIAHRLSTIRKMDRIIVIDKGKIVEDGTHEALSGRTGGIYAKLWKLQAGGFIK